MTTHSPFFLNALRPDEVRVLWRDEQGYTQSRRANDLPGVPEFVEHGALLGHLWMESQLGVGDPLVNQGRNYSPAGKPCPMTARCLELLVEEPSMEAAN